MWGFFSTTVVFLIVSWDLGLTRFLPHPLEEALEAEIERLIRLRANITEESTASGSLRNLLNAQTRAPTVGVPSLPASTTKSPTTTRQSTNNETPTNTTASLEINEGETTLTVEATSISTTKTPSTVGIISNSPSVQSGSSLQDTTSTEMQTDFVPSAVSSRLHASMEEVINITSSTTHSSTAATTTVSLSTVAPSIPPPLNITTSTLAETASPVTETNHVVPSSTESSDRPTDSLAESAEPEKSFTASTRISSEAQTTGLRTSGLKNDQLLQIRINSKKLKQLLSITNADYITLDVQSPTQYSLGSQVSTVDQ